MSCLSTPQLNLCEALSGKVWPVHSGTVQAVSFALPVGSRSSKQNAGGCAGTQPPKEPRHGATYPLGASAHFRSDNLQRAVLNVTLFFFLFLCILQISSLCYFFVIQVT